MLTLVMGHTVAAASTVLAAFMGGLAFGSWIGGRLENYVRSTPAQVRAIRLLRVYAALEIIVAISAILLPGLLAAFRPLLAWAYQDGLAPTRFGIVRVALSIVALGLPTAAMGATFPIAASWFASAVAPSRRKARRPPAESEGAADAGALYAANTAGAAAGAITAGLWLIPAVGVRATTWIGVLLNISVAIGAVLLARVDRGQASSATDIAASIRRAGSSKKAMSEPSGPVPKVAVACIATAISGLVALVYEVSWTRLLVLVIGPTTYAFTIVVASFIIGIALGSAAGARLVRRSSQPVVWLGAMLMMTGLAASSAGWFAASRLPLTVAAAVADPNAAFDRIVIQHALVIVILLLPMTCALGAAFPLALATAGVARQTIGRDLARVYVSNTVGAIAGALLAGFVLLPAAGLPDTFRAAAVISLLAALGVWVTASRRFELRARGLIAAAGAFALGIAVVFLLPPWDLGLLSSGAYSTRRTFVRVILKRSSGRGDCSSMKTVPPPRSACGSWRGCAPWSSTERSTHRTRATC